jgi:adenylylsulfate kinase
MLLIQLTGLSGAGKSTLAIAVQSKLQTLGYRVELIDGDAYRQHLCRDLGFSKADRQENIRRLGFVGLVLARNGVIAIMSAINPYESARAEIQAMGGDLVKTVWVDCDMTTLQNRDTKGLYRRAFLPDGHAEKVYNLTGVNDPYERPEEPDLSIHTHLEGIEISVERLLQFVLAQIASVQPG